VLISHAQASTSDEIGLLPERSQFVLAIVRDAKRNVFVEARVGAQR
jgi:hypothetical protein